MVFGNCTTVKIPGVRTALPSLKHEYFNRVRSCFSCPGDSGLTIACISNWNNIMNIVIKDGTRKLFQTAVDMDAWGQCSGVRTSRLSMSSGIQAQICMVSKTWFGNLSTINTRSSRQVHDSLDDKPELIHSVVEPSFLNHSAVSFQFFILQLYISLVWYSAKACLQVPAQRVLSSSPTSYVRLSRVPAVGPSAVCPSPSREPKKESQTWSGSNKTPLE